MLRSLHVTKESPNGSGPKALNQLSENERENWDRQVEADREFRAARALRLQRVDELIRVDDAINEKMAKDGKNKEK